MPRTARRAAALLVAFTFVLTSCEFTNMFPNANANYTCVDGNIGGRSCRTDNSTLTVFIESTITGTSKTNLQNALNLSYNNGTNLSVSYVNPPVTSGSAETDIIFQKGNGVPTGNIGWAWCNDAVTSVKCDQHYVRWTATTTVSRNTACHETGHSVGLRHGQQSEPKVPNDFDDLYCMERPSSGGSQYLGSFNIEEINDVY